MNKLSEESLQTTAKTLTHMIFRNSPVVEQLHSDKAIMDNETIKKMNKEINNRIYTLLCWYFSDDEEEREHLNKLYSFYSKYGGDWDKAEMLDKNNL